ncbi:DUF2073 domain-containing protein [Candidatus Woesearchaeota archaeon]|nr:DUF2073 domain-containing protein [Candidatus Woesearchaeota archaeon]
MPLIIQYIPYEEMTGLDSEKRIQKLLKVVKQNKVILMEGTLSPEEEAGLIEETMQSIDSKFKGVEISSFSPFDKNTRLLQEKIRQLFLQFVLGRRRGLTIIGPASIVKEIKRDPRSVQLFLSNRRQ